MSSSESKREALLRSTTHLLIAVGFTGTTARAIAAGAGCNVGLISYYFGSVNGLLLEALDQSSGARLADYQAALGEIRSLRELRKTTAQLYREDQATGHVKLLSEMVAGGLMDRRLGPEVARRVQPWLELTETAVGRSVPAPLRRRLPAAEIAYAVVAMFLGLEMLGSLADDHTRGQQVIERLSTARWSRSGA